MKKLHLLFALLALATTVHAQSSSEVKKPASEAQGGRKTIEGFWQDTARRILFSRMRMASGPRWTCSRRIRRPNRYGDPERPTSWSIFSMAMIMSSRS